MNGEKKKNRRGGRKKKPQIIWFLLLVLAVVIAVGGILLYEDHHLIKRGSSYQNGPKTKAQSSLSPEDDEGAGDKAQNSSHDENSGEIQNRISDTEGDPTVSANSAADVMQSSATEEKTNAADSRNVSTGNGQDARIEQTLNAMTLDEKVDRLFVLTPDQLTGTDGTVTVGETFRKAISEHPIGGYVLFEDNLKSPEQTRKLLSGIKKAYQADNFPIPILSVDEEGGTVTRIAKNSAFGVKNVGNMKEVGATGDPNRAAEAGDTIGGYLSDLGFNTDFAPDADVLTNPQNTVVAKRSFGSNPNLVTSMVEAECMALLQHDICPVIKHFPGHGATQADTHDGYAYTNKTLDELMQAELVPFENANAYAPMMMAAHISLPNVTGDKTPASLSKTMITDVLRGKLGYQGVVITDALNMGAIANDYSSSEASVKALKAGCDMLLMPANFQSARQGVLSAVKDGTLTEERINDSVRRILRLEME